MFCPRFLPQVRSDLRSPSAKYRSVALWLTAALKFILKELFQSSLIFLLLHMFTLSASALSVVSVCARLHSNDLEAITRTLKSWWELFCCVPAHFSLFVQSRRLSSPVCPISPTGEDARQRWEVGKRTCAISRRLYNAKNGSRFSQWWILRERPETEIRSTAGSGVRQTRTWRNSTQISHSQVLQASEI